MYKGKLHTSTTQASGQTGQRWHFIPASKHQFKDRYEVVLVSVLTWPIVAIPHMFSPRVSVTCEDGACDDIYKTNDDFHTNVESCEFAFGSRKRSALNLRNKIFVLLERKSNTAYFQLDVVPMMGHLHPFLILTCGICTI